MLLYQNKLATVTALTGKSFVPQMQKINMFVYIRVKIPKPVDIAHRLFSDPFIEISEMAKYFLNAYIQNSSFNFLGTEIPSVLLLSF